jgi:hypothetical protein
MSKIERRQRHIHAIELRRPPHQTSMEDVVNDPQVQHNIGQMQNAALHVPTFLQKNGGDPAVTVSNLVPSYWFRLPTRLLQNIFTRLREHLLPHIQEVHRREAASRPGHPASSGVGDAPTLDSDVGRFVFLIITDSEEDFTGMHY